MIGSLPQALYAQDLASASPLENNGTYSFRFWDTMFLSLDFTTTAKSLQTLLVGKRTRVQTSILR